MLYEKLGFQKNQMLKAEHLNHMEEGIANCASPSWNDIVDKPSYLPVVETGLVEILPETQLIADGNDFYFMEPIEGIDAGNTYLVTYNGIEYTCGSIEVKYGEVVVVVLADPDLIANNTPSENGAPFTAMVVPPEIAADAGCGMLFNAGDGATEVRLAIRCIADTYTKKLDNKCLDLSWLPVNNTTTVHEKMTVAHEAEICEGGRISEAFSYDVLFDGVMYYNVPGMYRSLGAVRVEYYIGNRSLYNLYSDGVEDTGEPFLIRHFIGPYDEDATTFYAADGGEHTISVSMVRNRNKMPEYYLPESVDGIVVRSSTTGSTKKFKLTVDDSGTISATEI